MERAWTSMAAGPEVVSTILNYRHAITRACICLLALLLTIQFGLAFTFVIVLVLSVGLLWYFWTETLFYPSETRVKLTATPTGKRERDFQLTTDDDELSQQLFQQRTNDSSLNYTPRESLTRKPLRARRTNAYSDRFIVNGHKPSQQNSGVNIFDEMNRSRRVTSPLHSGVPAGGFLGNLTSAALSASSPKSFISPRENMSFRLVFLFCCLKTIKKINFCLALA